MRFPRLVVSSKMLPLMFRHLPVGYVGQPGKDPQPRRACPPTDTSTTTSWWLVHTGIRPTN